MATWWLITSSDLRLKPCTHCKRLIPVANGVSLCDECNKKRLGKRNLSRDHHHEYVTRSQTEDKKYRKFYKSKEWQMTSRQYMVEKGHKCEKCGSLGTDVHHKQPIQTDEGWIKRFDFENLELLCVRCHNKAHGRTFGA